MKKEEKEKIAKKLWKSKDWKIGGIEQRRKKARIKRGKYA